MMKNIINIFIVHIVILLVALTVSYFSKLKFGSQRLLLFEIVRSNQVSLTCRWDCTAGGTEPLTLWAYPWDRNHACMHYLEPIRYYPTLRSPLDPITSSQRDNFSFLSSPRQGVEGRGFSQHSSNIGSWNPFTMAMWALSPMSHISRYRLSSGTVVSQRRRNPAV